MNLEALRTALEKYHRRKWFPHIEPDPLEEWADYATEATIAELVASSERTLKPSLLSIAYYIYSTMSLLKHKTLLAEHRKAYSDPLGDSRILPQFAFYYLRSEPADIARDVWSSWREWSKRWEKVLGDWLNMSLEHAKRWKDLRLKFLQALGTDTEPFVDKLESQLRASQDLFSWQLQRETFAQSLPELLQHFRLSQWDSAADWNDFPTFSRTVSQTGSVSSVPALQKTTQNDALQFLFPIFPPEKVILEYSVAAGPVDVMRFLFEFTKGWFFTGMNQNLAIEDRIAGDPALPYFWGYLYSGAVSSKAGLKRYVNPSAEGLADPLRLWMQFWYRYDAVLAIYRARMENSPFSEIQERYVTAFQSAFSMEVPDFLYLYDLDRAENAFFRVYANSMALAAEERLRSLYGQQWFASEACSRKFRDYWREGYRLSLKDVMDDLDVPAEFNYFWTFD